MDILVTGAAGFIGYHLSSRLLEEGHRVLGIDNLNDYYDPQLKMQRLKRLEHRNFSFLKMNLEDGQQYKTIAARFQPHTVINLAAQAGVRSSISNPETYIQSNLVGFGNILEFCRHNQVKHLIYASSSSVYGLNSKMPFSEKDPTCHPISLYAATKKANELMAHTYSHLYNLPTTGLRFFTVYGPWGRPDMALFKFTDAILNNRPIDIYNNGDMERDFTYIDDIINGMLPLLFRLPTSTSLWDAESPRPDMSSAPYRIYNIGNNKPERLEKMISILENALNKKAIRNYLPMQLGDVRSTSSDINALAELTGFSPRTSIEEGIPQFVRWYQNYYLA
ncbi:MAG: NAD-dependent epimerase [Desulfovibrionaceae bacterium]|nr:NAD-dependent epimerase [Desulfovibrionaceae bacterium]